MVSAEVVFCSIYFVIYLQYVCILSCVYFCDVRMWLVSAISGANKTITITSAETRTHICGPTLPADMCFFLRKRLVPFCYTYILYFFTKSGPFSLVPFSRKQDNSHIIYHFTFPDLEGIFPLLNNNCLIL